MNIIDTLKQALEAINGLSKRTMDEMSEREFNELQTSATNLHTAIEQLEKVEPVAWDIRWKDDDSKFSIKYAPVVSEAQYAMPLYLHPAPAVPVLHDIEQYRMQMAGISTAAIGYWKEGESIHPDYDTLALRDVAKLYAKYEELYKATHPVPAAPDESHSNTFNGIWNTAIDSVIAEIDPDYDGLLNVIKSLKRHGHPAPAVPEGWSDTVCD